MPKFEGTSDRSNLQDALEKAVQKALSSITHPDARIAYSVQKIGGRAGGVAGFQQVSGIIDAKQTEKQNMITVTGKLERVAAIGGETTGWAIQMDSETKIKDKIVKSIEVNHDTKKFENLANERVQAKGRVAFRNTIERGEWPILEVSTIREIKSK